MDNEFFTVSSQKNPRITVRVVAGHFATSSAHRSHYIDIFDLIASASVARDAARELSVPYRASTFVDAIVYMDNTEILAAFLADELLQAGMSVMNEGSEILLLTPMVSADGHFIFHRNVQEKIKNKNVVLMVASLSTGATANRMLECLDYYGCKLAGISAIFIIGNAGGSAMPMAARVSQKVAQEYNPSNFVLMHAMGPIVSSTLGSAILAGVLIGIFG